MQHLSDRRLSVRVERGVIEVDPAEGVANEDKLLAGVAESGRPCIRLWYNAPCIVLGRGYARRLPRPVASVYGLPVLVRSSGGEVVLHGPGVLNLSVAVPTSVWSGTIDEVFGGLSRAVAEGLTMAGWHASIGPILGSYCPGDHDVAVSGRKVLGISQRRTREALLVHGSLNVAVDPLQYGEILRSFYASTGLQQSADPALIGSLYAPSAAPERHEGLESLLLERLLEIWSRLTGFIWIPAGT